MICPKTDSQSNCPNCWKLRSSHRSGKPAFFCAVCSVQLPAMSQRHAYIRRTSCHAATPLALHCRQPSTTTLRTRPRRFCLDSDQTSRGAGRLGRPGRDHFGTGVGSFGRFISGLSSCRSRSLCQSSLVREVTLPDTYGMEGGGGADS